MTAEKSALRAKLLTERLSLSPDIRAAIDARICARVLAHPAYRTAKTVCLYAPVKGEADVTPIAVDALAAGKTVAYPRTGTDGRMTFYAVSSPGELVPGRYGIPEPTGGAAVSPAAPDTLLLIPALAYDRDGYRLGYGGGYYDRYLGACAGVRMGICRNSTLLPRLPREAHDATADYIITETEIYKVKNK